MHYSFHIKIFLLSWLLIFPNLIYSNGTTMKNFCRKNKSQNLLCTMLNREIETPTSICEFINAIIPLQKNLRDNFIDARLIGRRQINKFNFLSENHCDNTNINISYEITKKHKLLFEKLKKNLKVIEEANGSFSKFIITDYLIAADIISIKIDKIHNHNTGQITYKCNININNIFIDSISTTRGNLSLQETIELADESIKNIQDYYYDFSLRPDNKYFLKQNNDNNHIIDYLDKDLDNRKQELNNMKSNR